MKKFVKKVNDLLTTGEDTPLPLVTIPNHMGINLVAVDSIEWEEQDDEQLVSLTIRFLPDPKE
jgi:hypothetical protein